MHYKLTVTASVVSDKTGVEIPMAPKGLDLRFDDLDEILMILFAVWEGVEAVPP